MDGQKGYYNLNFTGFFIGAAVACIVFGMIMCKVSSWAWGFVKPIIHSLTA